MKKILDFVADLPEELRVEGPDAFLEHGRYLLFIELIGQAARDLTMPNDVSHHQEALEWVADPGNIQFWCELIGAENDVVPALQRALQERPKELSKACENFVRNVEDGENFSRFMDAMGIRPTINASTLAMQSAEDFEQPVAPANNAFAGS
jgi:hypothetical protein